MRALGLDGVSWVARLQAAVRRLDALTERVWPELDGRVMWLMVGIIGVFGALVVKYTPLPTAVLRIGLVIGLVVLGVSSIRRPELSFYTLVAYLPFSRALVGGFGAHIPMLNLTNLLTVWVVATVCAQLLRGRRRSVGAEPITALLLGFFGLSVWAWARAGNTFGAWYLWDRASDLKEWVMPAVFYLVTLWMVDERRRLKTVLTVMLGAITMVALMAVWSYVTGGGGRLEHVRVGGISQEPNLLGGFFASYMFLFLAAVLLRPSGWFGRLMLVPFLLCFRGIMVTFSRGAYLAAAAGGLTTSWFRSKRLFLAAMAVGVLMLTHPALLPPGIRYRFERTLVHHHGASASNDLADRLEPSASHRVDIWRGGVQMLKDHPWLGVGFGAFPCYIAEYTDGWISNMDAHNSFLRIAAEQGLPTLGIFLLLLGSVGFQARWLLRHGRDETSRMLGLGVLGGLAALVTGNLFNPILAPQEVTGYFWVLCALVVRAAALERDGLTTLSPTRTGPPA